METKLSLPSLQLFQRLVSHGQRTATVASETGVSRSYTELLGEARQVARKLGVRTQSASFRPIALLAPRNHHYCVGKLAILQAGGAFVPLHTRNPPAETEYILRDASCQQIVLHPQFRSALDPMLRSSGLDKTLEVVELEVDAAEANTKPPSPQLPKVEWFDFPASSDAMVVYTSGTTGRPKGVVKTHAQLESMAQSVVEAWAYTHEDRVLHLLPLHHLHGILNKLLAVMWAGGTVEFLEEVSAAAIWGRLGAPTKPALSMFHAVPTIYASMLGKLETLDEGVKDRALQHLRRLRLMVSGSAALPETRFQQWQALTGHRLLERYGTTEAGMMLGNPLSPTSARCPGHVGRPFPGIEARLIDPDTQENVTKTPGRQGEVRIRSKQGVFSRYHNQPDATRAAFDAHGFYKSGDLAEWDAAKQSYKILGRLSADILKSAGYKVSALEIEAAILQVLSDTVAEVAVVGRPHPTWGEEIVAVVRLTDQATTGGMTLEALRAALARHLAPYKSPRALWLVPRELPKNALGKVNKKTLLATLEEQEAGGMRKEEGGGKGAKE